MNGRKDDERVITQTGEWAERTQDVNIEEKLGGEGWEDMKGESRETA